MAEYIPESVWATLLVRKAASVPANLAMLEASWRSGRRARGAYPKRNAGVLKPKA